MKHMIRTILVFLVIFAVAACQPVQPVAPPAATGGGQEVVVFAAASLTDAFGEFGTTFSAAHPGATVTFNFAGSQQLAQQLTSGAPADVFASANKKQMQVAVDAGRIVAGTAQPFVHNRLVVITPSDNPGGIAAGDFGWWPRTGGFCGGILD